MIKINGKLRKGTSFIQEFYNSQGYPSAWNSFSRSSQRLLQPFVFIVLNREYTIKYSLNPTQRWSKLRWVSGVCCQRPRPPAQMLQEAGGSLCGSGWAGAVGVGGTPLCRDPRSSRKPMSALLNTYLQSDSLEGQSSSTVRGSLDGVLSKNDQWKFTWRSFTPYFLSHLMWSHNILLSYVTILVQRNIELHCIFLVLAVQF